MDEKFKIYVGNDYRPFVPQAFALNPIKYIEENGQNIKSGDIEYDENGVISEDPTASKFLPDWQNMNDERVRMVSKKVNLWKVLTKMESSQRRFQDPILEYRMMLLCWFLDMPAAQPVGFVEWVNVIYVLMERVSGFTWTDRDFEALRAQWFRSADRERARTQLKASVEVLKRQFEEFGIFTEWKYEDMVFHFDENRNISKITPVDWEWSYIDMGILEKKLETYGLETQEKVLFALQMDINERKIPF